MKMLPKRTTPTLIWIAFAKIGKARTFSVYTLTLCTVTSSKAIVACLWTPESKI